MAVNIYKNRLKDELRDMAIGESKVILTAEIPYVYLRSNFHVIAAELDMWFKCHSKKPYDKYEVRRIA